MLWNQSVAEIRAQYVMEDQGSSAQHPRIMDKWTGPDAGL